MQHSELRGSDPGEQSSGRCGAQLSGAFGFAEDQVVEAAFDSSAEVVPGRIPRQCGDPFDRRTGGDGHCFDVGCIQGCRNPNTAVLAGGGRAPTGGVEFGHHEEGLAGQRIVGREPCPAPAPHPEPSSSPGLGDAVGIGQCEHGTGVAGPAPHSPESAPAVSDCSDADAARQLRCSATR